MFLAGIQKSSLDIGLRRYDQADLDTHLCGVVLRDVTVGGSMSQCRDACPVTPLSFTNQLPSVGRGFLTKGLRTASFKLFRRHVLDMARDGPVMSVWIY